MTIQIKEIENDVIWFSVDGEEYGTEIDFDNEIYGIHDDNTIVNEDNYPLTEGDRRTIAIRNLLRKIRLR